MSKLSSTSLPWYRSLRAPRKHGEPRCIHAALVWCAAEAPSRKLLIDAHGCISRGELVDAMHHRARHLLDACGKAEAVVGVRLEPGVDAVVTYFACLAAGLRYLPLPDYPGPVMERMLTSLVPDLLIVDKPIEVPADIRLYDVANEKEPPVSPLPNADPRRIAHLLPTSGTESGVPKVVMTDHVGSMLSHDWRTALWGYQDDDVVGCNIFGIWDVVPALCNGIPVVMIDDQTIRDPFSLASMIIQYGITRLMLTPTLLDACLACGDGIDALSRLRLIVLCGEVVSPVVLGRAQERLPGTRIANLYSISECHDVAAMDLVAGEDICAGYIADFAEVHITDPNDTSRLLPVGEAGRVLIGGQGLARGYLDEELTRQRFFDVSFESVVHHVYDTDDFGSLEDDGRLTILGRIGDTVKVRGAWAEPDSIASVLLEHPNVRRAAILVDDGEQHGTQLVAFVVLTREEDHDTVSSLREWLKDRIPSQSVPSRILVIDDLPLMPSGKVDQRRLRDMLGREQMDVTHAGDDSPVSRVVRAFREVLDRSEVMPENDFFALGGDSLSAIALCGALHGQTGRRIRVADVYDYRTPAALARRLEEVADAPETPAWRLPLLDPDLACHFSGRVARQILVTGATGNLGSVVIGKLLAETDLNVIALVRGDSLETARIRVIDNTGKDIDASRLDVIVGNIAESRLGLGPHAFDELAGKVDGIVHAAADLNMFSTYEALAATNVDGTHELLRLALQAGARFCHVSSSGVFPLNAESVRDETSHGPALMETLAGRMGHSDGYSRTKLAAESLVWQAFELGLAGMVMRVPHLIGPGLESRLVNTISLLAETGMLPEGEWGWQVATLGRAANDLVRCVRGDAAPVVHCVSGEIRHDDVAALFRERGIEPRVMPMPALVSELLRLETDEPEMMRLRASMNQLVAEYGPWAAFSLADARLASGRGMNDNPRLLLEMLFAGNDAL